MKNIEVKLLSWTSHPLQTMAAEAMMYDCREPLMDLSEISEERAMEIINDIMKGNLHGCLEKVNLNFIIKNVPRTLTHQLVRTRIGASYAQQSQRFTRFDGEKLCHMPNVKPEAKERMKKIYDECGKAYDDLIALGVHPQDARGVLPANVNTHIMVSYSLKTLVDVASKRTCLQAQPFWQKVFLEIRKEVSKKIHPFIAKMLAPVCITKGYCPYQSELDRDCPLAKTLGDLQKGKPKYIHADVEPIEETSKELAENLASGR